MAHARMNRWVYWCALFTIQFICYTLYPIKDRQRYILDSNKYGALPTCTHLSYGCIFILRKYKYIWNIRSHVINVRVKFKYSLTFWLSTPSNCMLYVCSSSVHVFVCCTQRFPQPEMVNWQISTNVPRLRLHNAQYNIIAYVPIWAHLTHTHSHTRFFCQSFSVLHIFNVFAHHKCAASTHPSLRASHISSLSLLVDSSRRETLKHNLHILAQRTNSSKFSCDFDTLALSERLHMSLSCFMIICVCVCARTFVLHSSQVFAEHFCSIRKYSPTSTSKRATALSNAAGTYQHNSALHTLISYILHIRIVFSVRTTAEYVPSGLGIYIYIYIYRKNAWRQWKWVQVQVWCCIIEFRLYRAPVRITMHNMWNAIVLIL